MNHQLMPCVLCVLASLTACGGAPAPAVPPDAGGEAPLTPSDGGASAGDAGTGGGDLTLHGIRLGIVGEEGKRLHLVVVEDATGERVAELETTITGPESFTLPQLLVPGRPYGLHLYVDMDGNGACDPSREDGGDRGWSTGGIIGRAEGTTVPFHTAWIDEEVCARWD